MKSETDFLQLFYVPDFEIFLQKPSKMLHSKKSVWPTFDQDLTNPLVKCYLKRGKSKDDYPLTNIRLIISGV